jgi:dCTP deaminase
MATLASRPAASSRQPDIQEVPRAKTTGILPCQRIGDLIDTQRVIASAPIEDAQIQPASLDLRLGPIAYRIQASFLPGKDHTVDEKIRDLCMQTLDLTKPCLLERGCVYLVPVMEELALPSDVRARANPKSTTGRLDVFTRLITDFGAEFERVPVGYRGKLYVEIVPRTFSVLVAQGTRLNQLRFIRGFPAPSDSTLDALHRSETLVYSSTGEVADITVGNGLWVSVDLQGSEREKVVAYRARRNSHAIDLSRIAFYNPDEFWEPIRGPRSQGLILNPDDFYILGSKELLRVPPTYAAEMVPIDPSVGEYRVHYAGFFDPGFGYGNGELKGTRAVLEVRSHEVPFVLEDGQLVGRLQYEQLVDVPSKMYGTNIGSAYQGQGLALSKQFARLPFPTGLPERY